MKKDLIATALILGVGFATLGACSTTPLTPEEKAVLKTQRAAEKEAQAAFEELKSEFDTKDFSNPQ